MPNDLAVLQTHTTACAAWEETNTHTSYQEHSISRVRHFLFIPPHLLSTNLITTKSFEETAAQDSLSLLLNLRPLCHVLDACHFFQACDAQVLGSKLTEGEEEEVDSAASQVCVSPQTCVSRDFFWQKIETAFFSIKTSYQLIMKRRERKARKLESKSMFFSSSPSSSSTFFI